MAMRIKSRVRTGCLTCKRRKVKCDETQPKCLRCEKGGFSCHGYKPRNATSVDPSTAWTRSLVSGLKPASPEEHQSLTFFFECTALALSGPFDPSFWHHYVSQISYTEPAIRHGLAALGACHRELGMGLTDHAITFRHYGKSLQALQAHVTRTDEASIRVVLITCLISTVLEGFMGNVEKGAMTHLRSGLDILGGMRTSQTRQAPTTADSIFVEDRLVQNFATLELQAAFMLCGREALGKDRRVKLRIPNDIKHEFTNLSQAKYALDVEMSDIEDFLTWSNYLKSTGTPADDPVLCQGQVATLRRLDQWSAAFRKFHQSFSGKLNIMELQAGIQLKILEKMARIGANAFTLATDEAHLATPEFADLMKLIKSLLSSEETAVSGGADKSACPHSQFGGSTSNKPRFCRYSIESSIIMPLYFTAHCCADVALRIEAIKLLSATPRQEGFWNSVMLGRALGQLLTADLDGRYQTSPDGKEIITPIGREVTVIGPVFPQTGEGVIKMKSKGFALEQERMTWFDRDDAQSQVTG